MDLIGAETNRLVSLSVALILVLPLGGLTSPRFDGTASNDSRTFGVEIKTIGSFAEELDKNRPRYANIEITSGPSPRAQTLQSAGHRTRGDIDEPVHLGDSPIPDPLDSPFLSNDVLVYPDSNVQSRPSLDHDAAGNLYTVFEDTRSGDSDIYLATSLTGGASWNTVPLANTTKNENCPSIAIDYSPSAGSEMRYVFYEADELEFAWSDDGITWTIEDFGGGQAWWNNMTCPYVSSEGDLVVVVAQYDRQNFSEDLFYIFYTMDGFLNTTSYSLTLSQGYYVSQARVTIMDDDEVFIGMDVHGRVDPDPGNWWHDSLYAHGILKGDSATDDWDYWVWGSGMSSIIPTSPTAEASGHGVVLAQQVLDPAAGPPFVPSNTSWLHCAWTDDINLIINGTDWNGCDNDAWFLAFDGADTKDQKYPRFYREGTTIHAVWVNGTDINYKYSPDGGNDWVGDPATDDPYKVNEAGTGTHLDAWHSPDVDFANGKPIVVWHDSRGNGSIYFQTYGNVVIYTLDTQPRKAELWVREVGDASWHFPPYSYFWSVGTSHNVECISSYVIPNQERYVFSHWDDGSTQNPHTIIVDGVDNDLVCIFNAEYWLEMINPSGTTTPVSGWQPAGSTVTIEAFAPAPPPGGQHVWLGWTGTGNGSYTGSMNPCVDCVTMNESITQIANWQLQWDVRFDTVPPHLVLEINGLMFPTPSTHWFNDSESYTIFAPSTQMGGPGSRYDFSHWSDGGAQRHNVSVTSAGNEFIAYYVEVNPLPGPPGVLDCQLTGTGLADVMINWTLSPDDGAGEDDVASYEIYYGTTYSSSGSGYLLLAALLPGVTTYVHTNAGHGDSSSYFYRICAVDAVGQTSCDPQQASKYSKHLNSGMQLLSIPVVLSDTRIPRVFQTVDFERIIYYDAKAGKRHNWRTFDTRKPYKDLEHINHTMAVWIKVNTDSQLSVAGLVPLQTTIHLVVGWNFVGYPSFIGRTVNDALAGATYQNVETFDPANPPWYLKRLDDTDLMFAGEGYWIHVSNDFEWVLSN